MHRKPRSKHDVCFTSKEPAQLLTSSTDYELARAFHPDSPVPQALPSTVRHDRFHAITRAYDILRGRYHIHRSAGDPYSAELARRRRQHAWRQAHHRRAASAEEGGLSCADDAWKDQVIIVVGLVVCTATSAPPLRSHFSSM